MAETDIVNPALAESIVETQVRSRVFENIVSMVVLQGANYILPLIMVPYLVRVLGPAGYGLIAFGQAFVSYFATLVDYGFNLSATRQVTLMRSETHDLSKLVSAVMTIKILLALFGFLVVIAVTTMIPLFEKNRDLYLISYLTVIGTVLFPLWLYRGLEAMKMMSAFTILGRTLTVVATLLLVKAPSDMLMAAFIQSSGLVISGLIALVFIPRLVKLHLVFPTLTELKETLADGWHTFISSASMILYTNTNLFVLGLVASPDTVGYYAAANKLITAACGLIFPISQAVYPHIVALTSKSRSIALDFLNRLLWLQAGATLGVSLILFFLADLAVAILLGPKFEHSVEIVRIMAALPFVVGLSDVLGIQTMMTFDMKKQFSRITLTAGLLNAVTVFPMALAFGASGMAWSLLFIEVFIMLGEAFTLNKHGMLKHLLALPNLGSR